MDSFLHSSAVEVARLCLWLAILSLVFIPLERAFGLRRQPVLRPQVWTDLGYYFLSSLVPAALLVFPTAMLAWGVHQILPASYLSAVAQLPLWARLLAVLVVGEVGFYWGHRWSHELPILWRFHAIHHSAPQIDWLVNSRAHPVDMMFTRLCGLAAIYASGLAQVTQDRTDILPTLVILVGTVWGFFIHANVKWRFGWLEQLLASPAFHHWHHTNDEHRNMNYAAMLPFLDRIFGTFFLPKAWPPCYGVDDPLPDGMVAQLLHPLAPPQGESLAPPPRA